MVADALTEIQFSNTPWSVRYDQHLQAVRCIVSHPPCSNQSRARQASEMTMLISWVFFGSFSQCRYSIQYLTPSIASYSSDEYIELDILVFRSLPVKCIRVSTARRAGRAQFFALGLFVSFESNLPGQEVLVGHQSIYISCHCSVKNFNSRGRSEYNCYKMSLAPPFTTEEAARAKVKKAQDL